MLNYNKGKEGWQLGPRMLKWEDEQFEDGGSDEKLWKETGMDQPGSDSSISLHPWLGDRMFHAKSQKTVGPSGGWAGISGRSSDRCGRDSKLLETHSFLLWFR